MLRAGAALPTFSVYYALGKAEYVDVAYFNFEEDLNLTDFFKTKIEAFQIIEKLSIYRNKKIISHKKLIIFDEIQESNSALNSLKYFQEQTNEYHVVAAGDELLISFSYKRLFHHRPNLISPSFASAPSHSTS